ncbi:phage terminase small subunit P27 family [Fusobacterium ulcerans]|uniref:phage terminase small subunit P27 family n=1 Tax=Fusobacterium ulcerans TaxID=861 RepID=UPI0010308235|nr:phage terminase small subunit P27 family [Fusobacterium ulcerans]
MAGRPRKVIDISTGKIGKEAIKNRKIQEEKLKLGREQLKAPEWLRVEAKEEFERVVEEAEKIDILDNLDLGILAIYCNAYSYYVDVSKLIQENGYLGMRTTKYDDYETVHPLLIVQEKYVKQIMQCSTKLGLATTDRLKLIVPTKEDPKENKFIELIRNRKQG